MQTIREWLSAIGLEKYAEALAGSEVDVEALRHLSDADLKELGLPMGPRRKILAALAEPAPAGRRQDDTPQEAAPPDRRQLTVLFCDLAGSTALSGALDAEALRDVLRDYQREVTGAVRGVGGYLAKYMGDGVLAYFGYPHASEDAAERAVRAGLAAIAAVRRMGPVEGRALAARVGIATGPVVVGDVVGEGTATEINVIGEAPNIAARVLALAPLDGVAIAGSTRRLVGDLFRYEDLGPQPIKGVADPVPVHLVLGERSLATRFEAMLRAERGLFVGRAQEVGLLYDRWEQAEAGEGQLVLLAGEAGIGKSRVTEALRSRLGAACHRVTFQCSPQHTKSALYPVAQRLLRLAELAPDDTVDEKRAKLAGALRSPTPQTVSLVAEVVGLPAEPMDLTPAERRERTMAALVEQIVRLAGERPVYWLVEDAHWIDPTTEELIGRVVERLSGLRLLVVVTFRPDYRPPWQGSATATQLSLSRLPRAQVLALLGSLAGGKELPPGFVEHVLRKTDGIPLFVEELFRMLSQDGTLREGEAAWELAGPLTDRALPSTLHDFLMARLDRLTPSRIVAQIGAVIGREFAHSLVAAISGLAPEKLNGALQELMASGLVHQRGQPPGASYVFKHALMRDAAYNSLLKTQKKDFHGRVAEALEHESEGASKSAEIIAHHFTEAEQAERAVTYWLSAAQDAKKRYANTEAVSHFEWCVKLLEDGAGQRGEDDAGSTLRECLVALGDLSGLAGDFHQANRWYDRALAASMDDRTRLFVSNKMHRPALARSGGASIAYYEHGAGSPTIMFVNPVIYGLALFQPVIDHLCQEFRVVTVDCRGVGGSDPIVRPFTNADHARDFASVIDALGEPVVGVGISRGGLQLIRLAVEHPTLLRGLVTIGAPPVGLVPLDTVMDQGYLRRRVELVAQQDHLALLRLQIEFICNEPEESAAARVFWDSTSALPRETILSFYDPDPTATISGLVEQIPVPALVVHGAEDRLVSPGGSELLARRLPDSELHLVPGSGHLPLFSATEEFCRMLRDFIHRRLLGAAT